MNILLYISIFVVVAVVIYILYSQGFAVLKRTAAIVMVFRRGKNEDRVTFDSYNGWIKHVVKFHESKIYEFFLDAQLSKGNVEVSNVVEIGIGSGQATLPILKQGAVY